MDDYMNNARSGNRSQVTKEAIISPGGKAPDVCVLTIAKKETGVAKPIWKQQLSLGALIVVTSIWVGLVVVYALLSSSKFITMKIFQTPSHAILALNIGSTVAVFLFGKLINKVCDALRWALATQKNGVGVATFFALGSGTGILGTFKLLFSTQNVGHRKWCLQRYLAVNEYSIMLGWSSFWSKLF